MLLRRAFRQGGMYEMPYRCSVGAALIGIECLRERWRPRHGAHTHSDLGADKPIRRQPERAQLLWRFWRGGLSSHWQCLGSQDECDRPGTQPETFSTYSWKRHKIGRAHV